jgi:DNA-binding transcriptional ArsR family regulator
MRPQIIDPFQAIGDPNRRVILRLLGKKSLTINSLARHFDMTRPAVSKHIKILDMAGFISIQDVGRERHCKLNPKGFQDLQEWIDYFDQFWQTKLTNLENLLNKTYRE